MTCVTFPSVLASEASTLDCDQWSQLCEQWLWWRGSASVSRTWRQRWKKALWTQHLSIRTYTGSHGQSIEDAWTSYQADFPVSLSQQQVLGKPPKTHDTSGPSYEQGLLFSNQPHASSRTSTGSHQPSPQGSTRFSTMSSATWKAWVSKQRQDSSQRRKLAHPTSESDGSSWAWPTPTGIHAQRGNHDEPISNYEKRVQDYYDGKAKGNPGKSLGMAVSMVEVRRWPTPKAHMAQETGAPSEFTHHTKSLTAEVHRENWPTPTAGEGSKIPSSANFGQTGLSNHPEMVGNPLREKLHKSGKWPTPTARDGKNAYAENKLIRKDGKLRNLLPESAAYADGQHDLESNKKTGNRPGLLNATWVDALMGFPIGWTDLEPWAMQWYQTAQPRPSQNSGTN